MVMRAGDWNDYRCGGYDMTWYDKNDGGVGIFVDCTYTQANLHTRVRSRSKGC